MLTDVEHINLGLSKIAANRVNRIDPARTPLEAFMASNYPHWKRVELSKRRWVFALVDDYQLTLNETLTGVAKPYKYALPVDCLYPVRNRATEWVQRGRYVYSGYSSLTISYIKNVIESDFDPLFSEVLACKVAYESVEYVTQSNTKKDAARADYEEAVKIAGAANAFVIGSEEINTEEQDYEWVASRHG